MNQAQIAALDRAEATNDSDSPETGGDDTVGKREARDKGAREHMIVDRIYNAVMEQRLAPNTRLGEADLCKSFGVGRLPVRRALLLLSSQGIVTLKANSGARVACPDPVEAKEVFAARLVIESEIVRELAKGANERAVAALDEHVQREDAAREAGDRPTLIRLSGEFHVELARCHGNSVMHRIVRELVTRTSLIVAIFGENGNSTCPEDEHHAIIEAIVSGDADTARAEILRHLTHIQEGLELERVPTAATDLASILGTG